MKSILFLIAYPLEEGNRHLTQKFDAQINAAEELGLNAWYTAFGNGKIYLCNKKRKTYIGSGVNYPQNILQSHFIFAKIKKIFQMNHFQYCYIRSVPPIPSFISALKFIKKCNCKTVVEIPTYPVDGERKNSNRKIFYFIIDALEKLNGKREANYVNLYALIGETAAEYKGVPAINIQNGVNIKDFPLKKQCLNSRDEIHMLALACMSYWHGYDRVIKGLKNYYKCNPQTKIYLHLVGNAGDDSLDKWKLLSEEYGLNQYVSFHGFQTGDTLRKFFDDCDIAIGSLGLYRQGLQVASSIKIAEYCARGIPFIYAGKNLLLQDDLTFCMRVSNDDSDISISDVVEFTRHIPQQYNMQYIMRDYADKHMTWTSQLKSVIEYLDKNN